MRKEREIRNESMNEERETRKGKRNEERKKETKGQCMRKRDQGKEGT